LAEGLCFPTITCSIRLTADRFSVHKDGTKDHIDQDPSGIRLRDGDKGGHACARFADAGTARSTPDPSDSVTGVAAVLVFACRFFFCVVEPPTETALRRQMDSRLDPLGQEKHREHHSNILICADSVSGGPISHTNTVFLGIEELWYRIGTG
jgi:hypothetical protein